MAGVQVLQALDAAAIRRWSRAAAVALHAHRAEIDQLNVFPVADGDTGSNLALTMAAAADALDAHPAAGVAECLAVLARGAVLGARGNSGVIMSQLLRGLADGVAADGGFDGSVPGTSTGGGTAYGAEQLRAGLAAGVELAYAAVAEPVEGTILTVARAAVDALPPAPAELDELVRAAARGAGAALTRTPQQLPVLARAGVVDAGGQGLVVVLQTLAAAVTGEAAAVHPIAAEPPRRLSTREAGSPEFEYEVQYLLDAPARATAGLGECLARLGDSVVLAGTGDGTWNVHVHVNDVGAAIEAGVAVGAVRQISVVRFDEHASAGAPTADIPAAAGTTAAATTAVVAVAPGAALAQLFAREGITVVEDAAAAPLTASHLVAAIRATGAAQVVLLPNASTLAGAVDAAAAQVRADGVRAAVVPTRSPVQGLSAVAVHDPARAFDDDVVAMAEAAAATRYAEITVAGEQSLTSVGICEAGDVLGLIDGDVVEIGHGLVAVAFALVARLLGVGVEVMTLLVGPGAPSGLGELVAGHVRELAPLTDVTVYLGGQDGCPLVIGVE